MYKRQLVLKVQLVLQDPQDRLVHKVLQDQLVLKVTLVLVVVMVLKVLQVLMHHFHQELLLSGLEAQDQSHLVGFFVMDRTVHLI